MPRPSLAPRRASQALRPLLALGILASPLSAHAVDLSFKLEPGVAIPLGAPQSDIYNVGGSQSFKALIGLTPFLDIGPAVSFLYLPTSAAHAAPGVAWGLGGGLRLKRPHDRKSFHGVSPWFDADLLYVRTGELNRPGFDAGVGVSVPLGRSRTFWVGPFLRYMQIFQPPRDGFDNRDAKVITIGLSFEAGTGIKRRQALEETRIVTKEVLYCADRDQDGVPDSVDRCPEVVGTIESWGCPNYRKIVVTRDKLELKEKLYFAWDAARLEEASYPVLDEVVQALKDNKGFHVQVEGHADSTGPDDHNQTLSQKRAEAVLDYLAAHGVPKERLDARGFSSSQPLDTNTTVAGRENNRRVEFVVHFNILHPGSVK